MPPSKASASVTTGLKCAPEIGPNVRIRTTRTAPVAMVFARRAIATFPAASRSPMIPEPTTAATRNDVPRNSDAMRVLSVFIGDQCRQLASLLYGKRVEAGQRKAQE